MTRVRYLSVSHFNASIAAITLIAALLLGTWAQAENSSTPPAINSSSSRILLNGELVADEISRATGVAISPILGISVLGAYTYYTTPVEERGQVPWHAKPAFWVPLLVVLLGIILKDSTKIVLPKILILPLDAIETLLEKNTSAVLGLLVILSSITGKGIEQLQLAGYNLAFPLVTSAHATQGINSAATVSGFLEVSIFSITVTVVFGVVWVVSQSFNFLIFLSPSSWLDLLLTFVKNSTVAILVGAYLINPYLGLIVSCMIILLSLFLFARSYRFVVFGTIFSYDILFKKSREHEVETGPIKAFSGSEFTAAPPLSYGSLTTQNSKLVFHYRPWLIMPRQSITSSHRGDQCEAGIGTLSPVIITTGEHVDTNVTMFRLRPLYQTHEERIAEILGLKGVRDVAFAKSIRNSFSWLKEQLGFAAGTEVKQE